MAGYCYIVIELFFFCPFIDDAELRSITCKRNEPGQHPAILTEQSTPTPSIIFSGTQWAILSRQDSTVLLVWAANHRIWFIL